MVLEFLLRHPRTAFTRAELLEKEGERQQIDLPIDQAKVVRDSSRTLRCTMGSRILWLA